MRSPRSAPLALIVLVFGCGGRSIDSTSFVGEECGEDAVCQGLTEASSGDPAGGPQPTVPSSVEPSPADGASADVCALPLADWPLDFIVNEFVNHTDQRLYLASQNDDCGLWPAYVEFQRDGQEVDIYDGDCAADCNEITQSGYQSHGSLSPDCAPYPPCNAPLRLLEPGVPIYQFVFPAYGTVHDLPGTCFPDGAPGSCQARHVLPPGPYTLVARAFPALSCGDASCACNPDTSGVCSGTGGSEPALGTGDVQSVAVAFEFDRDRLGLHARYDFF